MQTLKDNYQKYHNKEAKTKREWEQENPHEVFFRKVIYSEALRAAKKGEEEALIKSGGWRETQKISQDFYIYKEICEKYGMRLYKGEFNFGYCVSGWAS